MSNDEGKRRWYFHFATQGLRCYPEGLWWQHDSSCVVQPTITSEAEAKEGAALITEADARTYLERCCIAGLPKFNEIVAPEPDTSLAASIDVAEGFLADEDCELDFSRQVEPAIRSLIAAAKERDALAPDAVKPSWYAQEPQESPDESRSLDALITEREEILERLQLAEEDVSNVTLSADRIRRQRDEARKERDQLLRHCAQLLQVSHVGDQNFIAALCYSRFEPIRDAILHIEQAMREIDGEDIEPLNCCAKRDELAEKLSISQTSFVSMNKAAAELRRQRDKLAEGMRESCRDDRSEAMGGCVIAGELQARIAKLERRIAELEAEAEAATEHVLCVPTTRKRIADAETERKPSSTDTRTTDASGEWWIRVTGTEAELAFRDRSKIEEYGDDPSRFVHAREVFPTDPPEVGEGWEECGLNAAEEWSNDGRNWNAGKHSNALHYRRRITDTPSESKPPTIDDVPDGNLCVVNTGAVNCRMYGAEARTKWRPHWTWKPDPFVHKADTPSESKRRELWIEWHMMTDGTWTATDVTHERPTDYSHADCNFSRVREVWPEDPTPETIAEVAAALDNWMTNEKSVSYDPYTAAFTQNMAKKLRGQA